MSLRRFGIAYGLIFWDTDEIANKIISLLRYEPLRKTITSHGNQEISLFTWDNVADQTLSVYREIV